MTQAPDAADPQQAALVAALGAKPSVLGVAVSGGGDSLSLLLACHRLSLDLGWQVQAATVDHALRPASAREAEEVARLCQGLGIAHQILLWRRAPDERGNVMDLARRARTRLLADWAARQGICDILLGHTADDQAETLLMGLSRASGLDGLCGLRPRFVAAGITWHRPFLHLTREALRQDLVRRGQAWVDDPSNDNPGFERVRMRRLLAQMAGAGLGVSAMAASARALAEAREALDHCLAARLPDLVSEPAGSGALRIERAGLAALPAELQRRLLRAALVHQDPTRQHPPRGPAISRLLDALRLGRRASLGGCLFLPQSGAIWICREGRGLPPPCPIGMAPWAGRWRFAGDWPGEGLMVGALGAQGLGQRPDWRRIGLPRQVLVASAALWQGGEVVFAPATDGIAVGQGGVPGLAAVLGAKADQGG